MNEQQQLWEIDGNGSLRLRLHPGQSKCWQSQSRFTFIIAGSQSGKTSLLPWLLWKEIRRTADPKGNNDYLAATASYDLFKLKFLPEMRQIFEYTLRIGRYWAGERLIELADPAKGFWAKRADDQMWGRIILRSAGSKGGLESATARAAILDECGQDEFTLEDWEAILRRLSLYQGRVYGATTPYNLGWLKTEIYDSWRNGDKDYNVINFPSIFNPQFPKAEFERAKSKMQSWRFEMFYLGQFSKPIGLIYADFTDDMLIDPFPIPANWERVVGVDFGGANTALVWAACDPDTERWYIYDEGLSGNKSTQEHVSEARNKMHDGSDYAFVGGAPGETQQRMDWQQAGLIVDAPPVGDVESGIDRVTELIKTNRFRVFRTLHGLRDEIGSYRRKMDEAGNALEEIVDKRKYHRLDACRYLATRILNPVGDFEIFTLG